MSLAPLRTLEDILVGADPSSQILKIFENGRPIFGITRREFNSTVRDMCWKLRILDVKPGDVVSLAMSNTVEYIASFLAAAWIRAIAAPMNPGLKQTEFEFYIKDVNSKILLVDGMGNSEAEMAAKTLNVPVMSVLSLANGNVELLPRTDIKRSLPPVTSSTWTRDPPIPTDVALYLHTSGTTSRPKLVPLTHHNLCTSIGNIRNTYELAATDVCYLVMPLFHVHGLVGGLFSTLSSGGTVVLPKTGKFSASIFWDDVVASNATWYTAVPSIHQILLRRSKEDAGKIRQTKSNLRFIRSCSSPLAPAVLKQIESTFGAPVLEAYAMTEASHQMTSNPLPKNGKRKPGTVGKPTNVQLAILDDKNRQLPPGQVGQICIRGENVTTGYYNRPEANITEFAMGWFHTGDQGFLDPEGYLTLTGRLKELINRGGEKISPIEIDSLVLSHPKVAEAVAFAGPHEKYGEEVRLAVVPKGGEELTAQEIVDFCASRLSKEKVPSKVFIVNSVPKTATGKIQRRFVAEKFNDLSRSKL